VIDVFAAYKEVLAFLSDFDEPFLNIIKEILQIRLKKMQDYSRSYTDSEGLGLANLNLCGWEGVVVRLGDKWSRLNGFALQNLIEGKTEAINEPVEDAFLDSATYSILGLMLYRKGVSWRKQKEG